MIQQYADAILSPVSSSLVRDSSGNLYTGAAKLYLAPPGTTDLLSVTPIDVTVVSGVWSHEFNANVAGKWTAQIRAEGATHGSSAEFKFRVEASEFPAPVVPVTP